MINLIKNNRPSAPTQYTRELFTDVGADYFKLGISAQVFKGGTDFEIWSAPTGGTQLIAGVDYEVAYKNERVSNAAGFAAYSRVRVLNATYQTGNIYITCKIVATETDGDFVNYLYGETVDLRAEDVNLQNQISAITGGLPAIDIYNGQLSNNITDVNNDIDIAAGFCYSSGFTFSMSWAAMTKRLDASWSVGSNAGGLFSGTKAVSTTYHVFIIRKTSDGSIDAGFDTSVTALNKPTGYSAYRRLGSIMTNSSGNIVQFIHTWQDKMFRLKTKTVVTSWQVPTTATLIAMAVPLGISVNPIGLFTPGVPVPGGTLCYNIYSEGITPPVLVSADAAMSTFNGTIGVFYGGGDRYAYDSLLDKHKTNTSGQLYFIRLGTGTYYDYLYYSTLQTHGWIDYTL